MATIKSERVDLRLTAVQKGYMAELAGPHGSVSSAVRLCIDEKIEREKRKKGGAKC